MLALKKNMHLTIFATKRELLALAWRQPPYQSELQHNHFCLRTTRQWICHYSHQYCSTIVQPLLPEDMYDNAYEVIVNHAMVVKYLVVQHYICITRNPTKQTHHTECITGNISCWGFIPTNTLWRSHPSYINTLLYIFLKYVYVWPCFLFLFFF